MVTSLYACGSNGASQLSLNNSEDQSTPLKCQFDPNFTLPDHWRIIDLVSASTHSLLLISTEHGNVLFGAGTNTLGQLGPKCLLWDDAKPQGRFKPVSFVRSAGLVGDWEPVKVAVTWTTSFVVYRRINPVDSAQKGGSSSAVGSSGSSSSATAAKEEPEEIVLACGSNDFGELGQGGDNGKVPVTRPSDNPVLVNVRLQPGERIEHIKGGQRHIVAVIRGNAGQRVVGWGASRKGELDGSSGEHHSKARANSTYRSTSAPVTIDLPLDASEEILDMALGASHTVILTSQRRVIGWGNDMKGQITDLSSWTGIRQIGTTWGGTYVLDANGGIFFQGSSSFGNIGSPLDGSGRLKVKVTVPADVEVEKITVGSEHLLAIVRTSSGEKQVMSIGWNEHGNLGLGDIDNREELERIPMTGNIKDVWADLATTWILVDEP